MINAKDRISSSFYKAFKKYESPIFREILKENKLDGFVKSLLDSSAKKDSYCEYMTRLDLANPTFVFTLTSHIDNKKAWTISLSNSRSLIQVISTASRELGSSKSSGLFSKTNLSNPLSNDDDDDDELEKDIQIMAKKGHSNNQIVAQQRSNKKSSEAMCLNSSFP